MSCNTRNGEAAEAYERAHALAQNAVERRALARRIEESSKAAG